MATFSTTSPYDGEKKFARLAFFLPQMAMEEIFGKLCPPSRRRDMKVAAASLLYEIVDEIIRRGERLMMLRREGWNLIRGCVLMNIMEISSFRFDAHIR